MVGGSGYLGSHFSKFLKKKGFNQIWVASRTGTTQHQLKLDILSEASINLIRDQSFDFVFNFSGQISKPIGPCLRQNSIGILNLIRACEGKSKLIQLSTAGVYGTGEFADELTTCQPDTPYSTAKLMAEGLIEDRLSPEDRIILRLSNIFGSSQPKGIFAYLIRSAKSDRVLNFNNDGSLFRFFLHVDDLSRALYSVIESQPWSEFPTLNLIGKDHFNIHQLIDLFEDTLGIRYQRNFDSIAPYDNMLNISDKKFRDLTGFEEKYSLESYIKELR